METNDICKHEFEVSFGLFSWIGLECKKCGIKANVKNKYARLCYIVGLLGWVPSFWISSSAISAWLKLLLSVTAYLSINCMVQWLFFCWFKRMAKSILVGYVDISNE